jgi:sigma-B regulation protein RsbU (phosphoserine phosphatase)
MYSDMREDMFISMAFVILEGRNIRLARAGHDAPLMYRKETHEVEVLKPGGLALGLDDGPVFKRVTRDHDDEMDSGDCLLLYTDGVTEAENLAGEEFGKDRLRETFRGLAQSGAEQVVDGLQAALGAFVGPARQMDDITLIAIEKR